MIRDFQDAVSFVAEGKTEAMERRAEWAVSELLPQGDEEASRWERKLKLAIAQPRTKD